ncbi:hypothetical protein Tco_1549278 [Tanacetum coccineum]
MISSTSSHLGSIPVPKYTLYPFSKVPEKTWYDLLHQSQLSPECKQFIPLSDSSFKKVSIKARLSCGMLLHFSYAFRRSSFAVHALSIARLNPESLSDERYLHQLVFEPKLGFHRRNK